MTSGSAPIDQVDRDRIRSDVASTMLVEAAAGTGKTTALVDRLVQLVVGGHATMAQVAAITFTEAAAAELRDRLRHTLESLAALPGSDEAARCAEALDGLDDAAVCTLHGFAQRILAAHPLEAGLPPVIEVLDEVAAAGALEAVAQSALDGLLGAREHTTTVLRALAMGLRTSAIRDAAVEMHRHWDRLTDATIDTCEFPSIDVSRVLDPLREAIAFAPRCLDAGDLLLAHLEGLAGVADRMERVTDELDLLAVLASAGTLTSTRGQKANWPDTSKADVLGRLEDAQEALDAILGAARRSVLGAVLGEVRRAVLSAAEERRSSGRLEFHDLLVLARDVLRRDPEVRRAVAGRFRILAVDEFQDTDPLQIEIAALIASGASGTSGAPAGSTLWEQVGDGRLFVVGDPKQSIYRFRRADIALYHEVEAALAGARARLVVNFRSEASVVAWVNHVFATLLGGGTPGVQAAHAAMAAHRPSAPDGPRVRCIGGEWGPGGVADVRTHEAREIARLVRDARDEGWEVVVDDEARPAHFGDMAILLPTRQSLPELERALASEGVPFRVEARSLIFATQEVRDLVNILQAVDDPGDAVAVVAALRTPAFACADTDLLAFRRAGGLWDPLADPPAVLGDDHPVVAGLSRLAALHRRRHWESVSQLVEAVISGCGLQELAFAHPRPRDHWRRLHYLAEQARAFADEGGASLRSFLAWVADQTEAGASVNEVVVGEPDDDAVRILTVHGSKGLEFPIVFLMGLNGQRQFRAPPVLFAPDGRLEARLGPEGARFETPGFAPAAGRERSIDAAEQDRLLYVAATRARDHLVVSLHHRPRGTSHARRLAPLCEAAPHLWRAAQGPEPETGSPATPGAAPRGVANEDDGLSGPETDREAWVAARRERIERLATAPVATATSLAAAGGAGAVGTEGTDGTGGPHDDSGEGGDGDEAAPWRRGRAGTAVGRAVHATLQSVDLATGDGLDAIALAQAAAEGVPDRVDDITRLARAALTSPVVLEAVASGRVWKEVYVGAPIGGPDGVVVEGYVDLLFETPEGLVVVDYKTDRVDGDPGAHIARYRIQGAAYATALEEALSRRVRRCVFVFVGTGRPIECEIPDLPDAVAEVRARVSGAPVGGR
jgi:ATP-dependent exoDNAse (exonuclease V) beta subunit